MPPLRAACLLRSDSVPKVDYYYFKLIHVSRVIVRGAAGLQHRTSGVQCAFRESEKVDHGNRALLVRAFQSTEANRTIFKTSQVDSVWPLHEMYAFRVVPPLQQPNKSSAPSRKDDHDKVVPSWGRKFNDPHHDHDVAGR